jgi:hypothetical protein
MIKEFNFENYIDFSFTDFSKKAPFNSWKWKRRLYKDLNRLGYMSGKNGMDVYCDMQEKIITIFLYPKKFDDRIAGCKFSWTREQVQARYGKPSRIRAALVDPILGEFGEADIFVFSNSKLHVEYNIHTGAVELYTFMNLDEL